MSLIRSVAIALVAALPMGLLALSGVAEAAGATCTTSVLVFSAHPDDNLLFESPDVLHDIQAGYCVRTVVASSGDAGADSSYWRPRETGARAAAANMAKVANAWTDRDAGVPGHPMTLSTLRDKPTVSIVFMRLDDGNFDGTGFPAYGNASMQQLWSGTISSIGTEDNSSSYTRGGLIGTLSTLMAITAPSIIRTHDYIGSFGDGDHSDHYALGRFTRAAHQQVSGAYTFIGYQGYNTASRPANVAGPDLTAKQNAFLAYARYDSGVCQTLKRCMAAGNQYGKWLQRQYSVGRETSSGRDVRWRRFSRPV